MRRVLVGRAMGMAVIVVTGIVEDPKWRAVRWVHDEDLAGIRGPQRLRGKNVTGRSVSDKATVQEQEAVSDPRRLVEVVGRHQKRRTLIAKRIGITARETIF